MEEINITEISGSDVQVDVVSAEEEVVVEPIDELQIKVEPIVEPIQEHRYQLNLYTYNGLLRTEIPRAVYAQMSKLYGDIMRAVPSNKWYTMQDIVSSYVNLNKRLKFHRKRNSQIIETAVNEMVDAGLIKRKN